MRFGLTGHQLLSDAEDWRWVRGQLERIVADAEAPLVGLCSLAVGADQLFAEVLDAAHAALEVVVPFPDYAAVFDAEGRASYERWLARASKVYVLPFEGTREDCYLRAGKAVTDRSDVVIAVWDGAPAAGPGGTGDVVAYARRLGKKTVHVDPIRRTRAELGPWPAS
jgi:hypothetical protein